MLLPGRFVVRVGKGPASRTIPPAQLPPRIDYSGIRAIPDPTQLGAGDILLFRARKPTAISRLITGYQRARGAGPQDADWYHAAVYIGDYKICDARRTGGVKIRTLEEYFRDHDWRVRRSTAPWAAAKGPLIAEEAKKRVGSRYDYLRIISLVIGGDLKLYSEDAQICSTLCAVAYRAATHEDLSDGIITPAALSCTEMLGDVAVDLIDPA